jgi:hypothetical protein
MVHSKCSTNSRFFIAEFGDNMSDQPINYEAVLADLENRKSQLEAAIAGIRLIMGQPGTNPSGPAGGGGYSGSTPAHDAFIGMSIPEAAKKHLTTVRKKLSTQELMTAMEAGGLPPSKYNTVYAILRRRENQVGDIINMKGDWGLAEWYPNYRRKAATGEDAAGAGEVETTTEEKHGPKAVSA